MKCFSRNWSIIVFFYISIYIYTYISTLSVRKPACLSCWQHYTLICKRSPLHYDYSFFNVINVLLQAQIIWPQGKLCLWYWYIITPWSVCLCACEWTPMYAQSRFWLYFSCSLLWCCHILTKWGRQTHFFTACHNTDSPRDHTWCGSTEKEAGK